MKKEKDAIEAAVDSSKSVLGRAYDDIAHPTAKSLGNTLSLLPRTVGVWLGKWEKWIVNGEESIQLTAKAVAEKAGKIPPEKLTEPEPYVAVPVIQQLSYCYDSQELREMYANLLVSSMHADTKGNVHPAFVEIIRQLTPDEAKLLKFLSGKKDQHPLIDIRVLGEDGSYRLALKNYTNISKGVCDFASGIFLYLDNLERLKLVEIHDRLSLADTALYEPLENSPEILQYIADVQEMGHQYQINRKLFALTQLCYRFMEMCISADSQ